MVQSRRVFRKKLSLVMVSMSLERCAKWVEQYERALCEGDELGTCASGEDWPLSGCVDIGMPEQKEGVGVVRKSDKLY